MGALDPRVTSALDELVPPRPGPDRWDAIVGSAGGASGGRRRWVAALPIAGAALAAAVLALAWPFGSGPQGTILERAAAAIGDGPVIHVVTRSGWGPTLVDLESGARTKLPIEVEVWYDPARGLHERSRLDGVLQHDAVLRPGRVRSLEKTLVGIARNYRDALRNGTARVLEHAVVHGEAVHWIRVESAMYPNVEDGKLHELAHDVGVSQETFEVVATRETLDGKLQPDGIATVLEVETLAAGEGNFTQELPDWNDVAVAIAYGAVGKGSFTPSEASAVLGRRALWAGPRIGDLELTRIWKDRRRERRRGEPWKEYAGVSVYYGKLDEGSLTYLQPNGVPFVRIAESLTLDRGFRWGSSYIPPEGSVLLTGREGAMHVDGVHVTIEASSEELLMAAARALQPVPEG
jgi:hypothetical protein